MYIYFVLEFTILLYELYYFHFPSVFALCFIAKQRIDIGLFLFKAERMKKAERREKSGKSFKSLQLLLKSKQNHIINFDVKNKNGKIILKASSLGLPHEKIILSSN